VIDDCPQTAANVKMSQVVGEFRGMTVWKMGEVYVSTGNQQQYLSDEIKISGVEKHHQTP